MFVLGFSFCAIVQTTTTLDGNALDLLNNKEDLSSILDVSSPPLSSVVSIPSKNQLPENAAISQSAAASEKADEAKQELKGTTNDAVSTPNEDHPKEKEEPPTDLCSAIPSTSSVSIWRRNLEAIKWKTKHYNDNSFQFHDFHARMMHYLTPQRLQNSVKTLPFNQWEKVGEILDISFKRYQYIQDQKSGKKQSGGDGKEPRKLRILIMGGSVTAGVWCKQNPVLEKKIKGFREAYRWAKRLEWFLEGYFPSVVQVDVSAYHLNLAV